MIKLNKKNICTIFKISCKIEATILVVGSLIFMLSGCDKREVASNNIIADPPAACYAIQDFTLKHFIVENTTDTKLLKLLAKDYSEIQQFIGLSKICAKHTITVSRKMRLKPLTIGKITSSQFKEDINSVKNIDLIENKPSLKSLRFIINTSVKFKKLYNQ